MFSTVITTSVIYYKGSDDRFDCDFFLDILRRGPPRDGQPILNIEQLHEIRITITVNIHRSSSEIK